MDTNKLLILLGLGIGGYFLYQELKPRRLFYQLLNGTLIPIEDADRRLPQLGYLKTAYGWIDARILQQLRDRAGAQSFSIESFANNIQTVYSSVSTIVQEIKGLFPGQTDVNQLILGDPGTDYNDYV